MNKFLLDTHVMLWWLDDSDNLSDAARQAIADPNHSILASSVSGYEIVWKAQLGKLIVPWENPSEYARIWQQERWIELPLSLNHAVEAGRSSSPHRDPFDRQLAAQAICESATLITIDPAFQTFPNLNTLW